MTDRWQRAWLLFGVYLRFKFSQWGASCLCFAYSNLVIPDRCLFSLYHSLTIKITSILLEHRSIGLPLISLVPDDLLRIVCLQFSSIFHSWVVAASAYLRASSGSQNLLSFFNNCVTQGHKITVPFVTLDRGWRLRSFLGVFLTVILFKFGFSRFAGCEIKEKLIVTRINLNGLSNCSIPVP